MPVVRRFRESGLKADAKCLTGLTGSASLSCDATGRLHPRRRAPQSHRAQPARDARNSTLRSRPAADVKLEACPSTFPAVLVLDLIAGADESELRGSGRSSRGS